MGNTESVVVQKRLARFRPEERPVIEGVFDKIVSGAGGPSGAAGRAAAAKPLTIEMLQVGLLKHLTFFSIEKKTYNLPV